MCVCCVCVHIHKKEFNNLAQAFQLDTLHVGQRPLLMGQHFFSFYLDHFFQKSNKR